MPSRRRAALAQSSPILHVRQRHVGHQAASRRSRAQRRTRGAPARRSQFVQCPTFSSSSSSAKQAGSDHRQSHARHRSRHALHASCPAGPRSIASNPVPGAETARTAADVHLQQSPAAGHSSLFALLDRHQPPRQTVPTAPPPDPSSAQSRSPRPPSPAPRLRSGGGKRRSAPAPRCQAGRGERCPGGLSSTEQRFRPAATVEDQRCHRHCARRRRDAEGITPPSAKDRRSITARRRRAARPVRARVQRAGIPCTPSFEHHPRRPTASEERPPVSASTIHRLLCCRTRTPRRPKCAAFSAKVCAWISGSLGHWRCATASAFCRSGGVGRRATLAALLLEPNRVVAADRLVDVLWGESPPPSARGSLQNHVWRLRRVLGDRLETRAPGYLLRVEPEDLDLDRFRRLVAEAERAEPEDAAALLRRALALWRGPVLADLTGEPVRDAAAHLDELHLAALEARIDADLALGRHVNLIPELETLIDAHPFREGLRRQLILALYRSDRQAEALEAYASRASSARRGARRRAGRASCSRSTARSSSRTPR